ncbi:MAG: hypothetical protein ABSH48_27340 [Verrucomicrobiota bacterium]|jgi:hypothetical protein
MNWTPLTFSRKHKGESIPEVLFHDPDWFFWAWDQGVFKASSAYHFEAVIAHARATSIRVPQVGEALLLVEYNFNPDGTCIGFDLVPADRPQHQGSTCTQRSEHIDLSVPHQVAHYDKLGNRIFLRSVKSCLFGDPATRMTRQRCEAFFNDTRHFIRNG